MTAYINGELSLQARRRIGRYIDEDPACYAEYIRQRDLKRELEARLSAFGQAGLGQLDRIWANVQRELQAPVAPMQERRQPVRYGLVTLAVVMVMVIPLILGAPPVSPAVATPPQPNERIQVTASAQVTRAAQGQPTPVALATHYIEVTGEIPVEITPAAARTPDTRR
ncbi:MAG: hypothetical protein ACOCXR_00145 [Phototrophicaceae bacterium]